MATLYDLLKGFNGSMGNVTFRKRKGVTITSLKVEKKRRYVATISQARVSMRWGNLVNVWREFHGKLHPSFETVDGLASDFNIWMKYNMKRPPVYLTKDEFDMGGSVISNYVVSVGSLPRISTEIDNGNIVSTNIQLGSGFTITSDTTVKQFSEVLLSNNESLQFEEGDLLTAFKAVQTVDDEGLPRVSITAQQVMLSKANNTTLLRSLADADCFSVVNGKLGASAAINGGIVWIHSRKTGTAKYVSPQRFVVTNPALSAYQTRSRMEQAAQSYGSLKTDEYLTPGNDDDADVVDVNSNGNGLNP